MVAPLCESVVSLPGVFFHQVSAPPPYLNVHFSLPISLSFFIFSSSCNNLTCFIRTSFIICPRLLLLSILPVTHQENAIFRKAGIFIYFVHGCTLRWALAHRSSSVSICHRDGVNDIMLIQCLRPGTCKGDNQCLLLLSLFISNKLLNRQIVCLK